MLNHAVDSMHTAFKRHRWAEGPDPLIRATDAAGDVGMGAAKPKRGRSKATLTAMEERNANPAVDPGPNHCGYRVDRVDSRSTRS